MSGISRIKGAAFLLAGMCLITASFAASAAMEGAPASEKVVLVNGDDGKRFWQISQGADLAPRFPADMVARNASGCVNLGFVILPDGSTTKIRMLKSVPRDTRVSRSFGAAAAQYVSKLRYEPGLENPERVQGFASIPADFHLDAKFVKDQCKIEDLEAFIRAAAVDMAGG
ncbi:MAG: energy transducer TonB [Pseudoxanthomonas sp.]